MTFFEVDIDAGKARADKWTSDSSSDGGGGGGGDFTPTIWVKLGDGQTLEMRVMPPWTDKGPNGLVPYCESFTHWKCGPDGNKQCICPRKLRRAQNDIVSEMSEDRKARLGLSDYDVTQEDPCYICEELDKKFATGAKADKDFAMRRIGKRGLLFQVLDLQDPVWTGSEPQLSDKPEKAEELRGKPKIKMLRLSPHNGGMRLVNILNDPGTYGLVTHPYEGTGLKLSRTGSGFNDTEYHVEPLLRDLAVVRGPLFSTPSGEPDKERIIQALEAMVDIDSHPFFRSVSYEYTRAIWMGIDPKTLEEGKGSGGSSGGSGHGRAASPASPDGSFAAWKEYGERHRSLTASELANESGWQESQVPKCYSNRPDHNIQDCRECPIRGFCAARHKSTSGKWSLSEPTPSAPSVPMGRSAPPPTDEDIPF